LLLDVEDEGIVQSEGLFNGSHVELVPGEEFEVLREVSQQGLVLLSLEFSLFRSAILGEVGDDHFIGVSYLNTSAPLVKIVEWLDHTIMIMDLEPSVLHDFNVSSASETS
jgi:hypothetical protein